MKEKRLKMKLREIQVMRMGWIWLVEISHRFAKIICVKVTHLRQLLISVRSNFVNRTAFTGTCLLRSQ